MKTILNLICVVVIFLLIGGTFFLIINKTFIYEVYTTDSMAGDGITLERFMYLSSEDEGAEFITFVSEDKLEDLKNDYLNSLSSCYGVYYYDQENNITILDYTISDYEYFSEYLRKVNIKFDYGNYCSTDYILDDQWIYECNNFSEFEKGDITESAFKELITTLENSSRIESPTINTYETKSMIEVTLNNSGTNYTLTFSDFDVDKILVKKIVNSIEQVAVYQVDDALRVLSSLDRA